MTPSSIIFVVDRLGAGFLGPYGNTWVETQSCNRLASEGLLCEFALSDSLELETVYRSYWTGRHAMDKRPLVEIQTLPELAGSRGVKSILLTDEPRVAEHPLSAAFAERTLISAKAESTQATDIEETQIARLTQAALELISKQREPYLLWIHSHGMSGPWDAPQQYRQAFRDEDDPQPGDFTAPPHIEQSSGIDPDELLKFVHAYAGQVTVMDLCLGALLDAAQEHPHSKNGLFAFTSPRGYPLGEHGQIGPAQDHLYGEVLNVPLMIRLPEAQEALCRTPELVQPADLHDLLRSYFDPGYPSLLGQISRCVDHPPREMACAVAHGERAIRTPAWFLREVRGDESQPRTELYSKPDDRWEVNEVSNRAGAATSELMDALNAFEQAAMEGRLDELTTVSEALSDQWR